jgi:hypothetical protein
MLNRAGSAVANCIISGIAAAIGWALATLIPARRSSPKGVSRTTESSPEGA